MNQNIIKYIIENKEKYSREALVAELDKAGYGEEEIIEAAKLVYEAGVPPKEKKANFWNNLRTQKIYTKTSEKAIDFILGFFVSGFVVWIIIWFLHLIVNGPFMLLSPLIYILALVYLYKRRRYMFYGLLADLLIPLAGIIFLFFVIGGF